MMKEIISDCPVRKSFEVIGGKWKLLIIDCCKTETKRYGDLKKLIPDISEKMLIQELKALVKVGILHKQSYNEVPPKVEYSLTVKGRKAIPVIETLRDFGKDYF